MRSNKGPFALHRWFQTLSLVSQRFPRHQFMAGYANIYKQRKDRKMRGNLKVEQHFKTELDLYHSFVTSGPPPWDYEASFHHLFPFDSIPVAFKRKPQKLLNTFQIRRNITEGY